MNSNILDLLLVVGKSLFGGSVAYTPICDFDLLGWLVLMPGTALHGRKRTDERCPAHLILYTFLIHFIFYDMFS